MLKLLRQLIFFSTFSTFSSQRPHKRILAVPTKNNFSAPTSPRLFLASHKDIGTLYFLFGALTGVCETLITSKYSRWNGAASIRAIDPATIVVVGVVFAATWFGGTLIGGMLSKDDMLSSGAACDAPRVSEIAFKITKSDANMADAACYVAEAFRCNDPAAVQKAITLAKYALPTAKSAFLDGKEIFRSVNNNCRLDAAKPILNAMHEEYCAFEHGALQNVGVPRFDPEVARVLKRLFNIDVGSLNIYTEAELGKLHKTPFGYVTVIDGPCTHAPRKPVPADSTGRRSECSICPDFLDTWFEQESFSSLQCVIFFFLMLFVLGIYFLTLANWSSNSKYAFMAVLRNTEGFAKFYAPVFTTFVLFVLTLVTFPVLFLAAWGGIKSPKHFFCHLLARESYLFWLLLPLTLFTFLLFSKTYLFPCLL